MKYTIMGFNQAKAVELNLDCDDLLILSYFSDFRDTELMVSEEFGGKRYYWLKYDALLENLPILRISTKGALRNRLKKLQDAKVLNHYCKKTKEGTYSFYGVGENFLILKATMTESTVPTMTESTVLNSTSSPVNNTSDKKIAVGSVTQISTGAHGNHDRVLTEISTRAYGNHDQNINLLKDYPIKNITLLEDKKEQSSSSDSLTGIRKVIYDVLLPLSTYKNCNAPYETFFKEAEITEYENKVEFKGSKPVLEMGLRKYRSVIEKALDKPVELVEMEV